MTDMQDEAIQFLSEFFDREPASIGSGFSRADTEDWDSVNHFRLVMELEERFGVSIDDEMAMELDNLEKITALISSAGGGEAGNS